MKSCTGCHPDLLPDDRLGEHHVGVRFGDRGPHILVTLDGVDVTREIREALAGEHGWVDAYMRDQGHRRWHVVPPEGPPGHAVTELRFGNVQIRVKSKAE